VTKAHRILWGEGVFLRPQHFQQQDLYFDSRLQHCMGLVHTHPWGLRALEVDREILPSGLVRLNRLEMAFQDGTFLTAPYSEPLPLARNLNDIPNLGVEILVYACLPLLNAYGGNCGEQGQPTNRPVRYFTERVQATDLYTDALEAEIASLKVNVRLMMDGENRDGHLSVPVVRLLKSATGVWSVDEAYVPPILEIQGAPPVQAMLRRLLDIILIKSRALTASHRERVKSVVEYGTSDIASFWLLHTVNRTFPLLNHLLQFPQAHPEELYKNLAQLAGELITFSSTLTLSDIPPYKHDGLTETFQRFDTLIRQLLETVISSRYAVIPLVSTRPSFFVGRLESDHLTENVDYYLSVASEHPANLIIESVPLKLKVGSPDDVEKILNSAMAGVRLNHVTQTPAAVPVRIGNHYFELDPHGTIYDRMIKSRSVCIYAPKLLPDMKFELIAVFR
jgi:type VI secretion system protein ImpJ